MKNFFNFFGNNGSKEQLDNEVLDEGITLDDVFNSDDRLAAFGGGVGESCGSQLCKDQASW